MDLNVERISEDEMPRDRLSDLNDSLLQRILSFLPFRDSVRTSTLSHRWRDLWRFTRNVEFREDFFSGPLPQRQYALVNFMRRWIEACPEPALDSLELSLSRPEEFPQDVENCISFAVGRRVKHLGLDFSDPDEFEEDSDMEEPQNDAFMALPDTVYKYSAVGSMRLFSCRFFACKFGNFHALQKLSLGYVKLRMSTISTLLEKCPLLESFMLERCWIAEDLCTPGKHSRLETLIMDRCNFHRCWYRIEVPNLRVFKYSGRVNPLEVDVGLSPALQEVELDFSQETEFDGFGNFIYMLMWSLSEARVLTIGSYMLQVIPSSSEPLGMEVALNVRHLILKTAMHSYDFWGISFFLNSCPFLETLTIEMSPLMILEDYEPPLPLDHPRSWGPILSTFECITSLKVVEVKGFKGTAEEMFVLEHLMLYGEVMKNLNLYISKDADTESAAQVQQGIQALMAIDRVSQALQIVVTTY